MFRLDVPMTWRELGWFLFGRKRCPACTSPLERQTKTHDEGFDWHREGADFDYAHTTRVEFEYECRRCRRWYALSELAARWPSGDLP